MTSEIFIPAGTTFLYDDYDKSLNVLINVKSFYIDRSPVTYLEFREFLMTTGGEFSPSCWKKVGPWRKEYLPQNGGLSDAATCVTWGEATAYAKWKGRRLPTWVEFLRAARGYDEQRKPASTYIRENPERIFAPIQFQNLLEWTMSIGIDSRDNNLAGEKPVFSPAPFIDDDPKSQEQRKQARSTMTFLPSRHIYGTVGFRCARDVGKL